MSRKALGRGLEALIPKRTEPHAAAAEIAPMEPPTASTASTSEERSQNEARIDSIAKNPYQPRREFDPEQLRELAQSIRENGILQPLLVRIKDDGYELIAGERRLRAARIAGLLKVPIHVREANENDSLRLAILENVQRQDLNAIEEARGYQRLLVEFEMSQQEIADRLGKSRSVVANTLRLLNLPKEIQKQVERGELTAGHARALLQTENPEEQARIINQIREQHLTVRDVEQIAQRQRKRKPKRPEAPSENGTALLELQRRLETKMGTRVRIKSKKKDGSAGRIEIEYYTEADLERLFSVVGVEYLI